MKLKPSKSLDSIKDSIKEFITKLDNYLSANMDGEWNMLGIIKLILENQTQHKKIVEKFSYKLIDYRINAVDIKDENIFKHILIIVVIRNIQIQQYQ